jgi:hypothetical protein
MRPGYSLFRRRRRGARIAPTATRKEPAATIAAASKPVDASVAGGTTAGAAVDAVALVGTLVPPGPVAVIENV